METNGSVLHCLHFPSWLHGGLAKRCRLRLLLLSLLVCACVMVMVMMMMMMMMGVLNEEAQRLRNFKEDSYLVMRWEGFGPEKGVYNFTVVTAMLDIGRGHWTWQSRSYNTYLLHMHRVLQLDVNLIIFVDAAALPFILWMRRGRKAHTHIVEVALQSLPYYAFRDRIQVIMDSQAYQQDNQLVERGLCESRIPEYDIIQWSKLYFLNESITLDPFKNDFFIWLDGGYGHGKAIHPEDGVWRLTNLFEHADRVTLIEREPVEKYRSVVDKLHKLSVNVVAGGFVAGGKKPLQRLYQLQQALIREWMDKGVVDDDQTTYLHIYYKHPHLFRLVSADWDDVFNVFHAATASAA